MNPRVAAAFAMSPGLAFGLLSTICAPAWAAPARSLPAEPPNIVLILADDLAWGAVGYNGSFIRTPNIDRLASQGVQLTQFYVSPMCSPTRAGLMTGRYPLRLGMARTVVRPWLAFGLPPDEQTLPEALASAGYRHRGIFGKWHLGHLRPTWHPLSQGFTEFRGQYNGASDYWTRVRDGEPDWHHDATPIAESGYTTDLIADSACAFIRRHAGDGPFFCYVPFTAPHDPLQAPEKYLAEYGPDTPAGKAAETPDRRALAAMVTCMDDGIGRILRTLRDNGLADKTLVWFLSDNGGVTRLRLNGTMREGKLTVYEGGVRVPSALWWPGMIEGGRKIREPMINTDILPTLLRIARSTGTAPRTLDGVDASGLLTGQVSSLPGRDFYFFTGQAGLQREQIAVRSVDGWKLVVIGPDVRRPEGFRTPRHQVELFRISEDPDERKNLAAENPEIVKRLGEKVIAFRSSEPADAMPTANRPPSDFKPPQQWRNSPVSGPAGRTE